MAEKVRCEICDRTFKDAGGLSQHNAAVHSGEVIKQSNKKVKGWIIFVLAIIVIVALVAWAIGSGIKSAGACKIDPVTEINIGGHKNIILHEHAELEIIINGIKEIIPANIGISTGIMRPLHTHDATGEIHMEGPCARDFKLGEFFDVLGRELNNKCIFDNCNGSLTMKVNGQENNEFENYVMNDGDNIVIEYSS